MPSLPVHRGGILHSTSPVTTNYFHEPTTEWKFELWSAGLTKCSLVGEYRYFRRPVRDHLLLIQDLTTPPFWALPHCPWMACHHLWPSATHCHSTYVTVHLPARLFFLDSLTLKMKAPQLFKMLGTTKPLIRRHIPEDLSLHFRGTCCLHFYPASP